MLIVYVVAAIAGGLATLGTGWSAFGLGTLLLAPLGGSLAVLAVALPVGLFGSRSRAEEDLTALMDHLVGSLRRSTGDAVPPPSQGTERRKRVG